MPRPEVEITEGGRGGGITYREGTLSIPFDWEFAMSPTLALIWGPKAAGWDTSFPWAAGRQREVYDFVGSEVVRQKANDAWFAYDLEAGTMDLIQGKKPIRTPTASGAPPEPSPAYRRFQASVVPVWQSWRPDQRYDVGALSGLAPEELAEVVAMLSARETTWREVEALAAIPLPAAQAAVRAALSHHLSIDTRLAAAEALSRADPDFDLEPVLARQLRALNRPTEGLDRALRLAAEHPTPVIQQALLWASYNATDCAPACAELLLRLRGVSTPPHPPEFEAMLLKLGLHNSSFDRSAAFETLSRAAGMVLDTTQFD